MRENETSEFVDLMRTGGAGAAAGTPDCGRADDGGFDFTADGRG